jgi:hypothetical protein
MSESSSHASHWPSRWPILWLGGQFVALCGLLVARDSAETAAMWDAPMGRRMLLVAGGLFAINVATYWPLATILLRRIAARSSQVRLISWVCLIGLTVGCLLFLVAPVAFVLILGPSAVQIQQNLAPSPTLP